MSHHPVSYGGQDCREDLQCLEAEETLSPRCGDGAAVSAEYEAAVVKDDDFDIEGTVANADDMTADGTGFVGQPDQQEPWIARMLHRVMPHGGFTAGVFNLAGSSLGAGILGLPYAFDTSGVVMGTIYLVVVYLLTIYSFRILAKVYLKTNIPSYELTARHLLGRGGDIFTAVIMFVKCIGACIAYVIAIGDLWHAFLNDDRVHGYYKSVSFNRILTSATFIVLMLPLSLPKQINSLRYVSLFGVVFILFFVVCVVIHSCTNGLKTSISNHEVKAFNTGNRAIQGLGQYVFAFLAQSNAPAIFRESSTKTVHFFELQIAVAMLICTIFYWLAGFFGYADFGGKVGSSLLRMYKPLEDYYFAVAYIGLVVKLCVAFALHILPCRDAVHHLIHWELETIAWWKNAVLCIILSLVSLLCGLFIPNVNVVFGLLGSFTGSFIAFVFPSFFFMYSGGFELKKIGAYDYFGTYFLLLCGIIIICFGTSATIYGLI